MKPSAGRLPRAHPVGPERRRALETIADRWALWLLLAIDETEGSIFSDFVAEPGLSRRVLAAKLQLLVAEALVETRQYQARPVRNLYVLTPRGQQARRLALALVHVAAGGVLVSDPLADAALESRGAAHALEPVGPGAGVQSTETHSVDTHAADAVAVRAHPADALLASDPAAARDIYARAIEPLVRYDDQYRTSLVETLVTWFACDASVSMAAARMFAHRHTISYRLARVRELTELDSSDAADREQLALGLRAMRLLGLGG